MGLSQLMSLCMPNVKQQISMGSNQIHLKHPVGLLLNADLFQVHDRSESFPNLQFKKILQCIAMDQSPS